MSLDYLSLQGSSHLALNVGGKATVLREMGNQTAVEMSISSETYERFETKSGKRQKVLEQTKARSVNLSITLDEQKREDVALAMQAEIVQSTGKTVTGETLFTLKAGDEIKLGGFNLTNVVVKDSTASPVTLVEGEHYTLDAAYGTLKLLSTDGITQPLKVDYTEGNVASSVLFTLPDGADYYFLFKGVNSIDNKRLSVELWRFKPSVDGSLQLINDETGELTVTGSALADNTKQQDPKLGGFGRLVYLD